LNWIAHWYRREESLSMDDIAARFIDLFDIGLHPD
jgi:hypothetical protein